MPRAAPVTTATLPASGLSASARRGGRAGRPGTGRRRRPSGRTGRTAAGGWRPAPRPRRAQAGSPVARRAAPCRSTGSHPSSACRAAACAGGRRRPAGREIVTTRPPAASPDAGAGASIGRQVGRRGRLRRAPPRPPSRSVGAACPRTCRARPASLARTSAPAPEPSTRRARAAAAPRLVAAQHGRLGQAELLGQALPKPELTKSQVPVTPSVCLQDGDDALAAGGADGDQARACRAAVPRAASSPARRRSGRRSRRTGDRPPATSR